MKKILFVSHSSGLLGAERSLIEIVSEAITKRGYHITVVMPGPGPLADACLRAGVNVRFHKIYSWMGPRHAIWPFGIARLLQILLGLKSDRALLRCLQPDLVITNSSLTPGLALAARGLGAKRIWIVRESIRTNRQLGSVIGKRMLVRVIMRNSDAVCAVSSFVSRQIADLYGAPAGVNLITPRPEGSSFSLEKARFPNNEFRLLMVGFISAEKGQGVAVRAMRAVKQQSAARVQLRIVGRGPRYLVGWMRILRRALRLDEGISIVPWTNNVDEHYQWADAVLMLSANEAYGRVTAEALLRGIPVIAVGSGATPEILALGGGELIRDRKAKTVAAKIVEWSAMSESAWNGLRTEALYAGAKLRSKASQFCQLEGVLGPLLAEGTAASALPTSSKAAIPLYRHRILNEGLD